MLMVMRQRNFALLWFAGLISLAGDYMLFIALPIYVYELTGSALATSGIIIANRIPAIVVGPVAGVFVDRWDRRRVMVVTNLLRCPLLLLLLFVDRSSDLWLVYLVAFTSSAIAQFFSPAENAILPLLVSEDRLVPANALNSLNNNLARLVGPPIGGLLASAFGLSGAALADSASFLIAGALTALVTINARPVASAAAASSLAVSSLVGSVWHDLLAGLRLIRAIRTVRIIFWLTAMMSLGEGVMGVLFIVFVNNILEGGVRELGWIVAAQAVGGLAGGMLIGAFGSRFAPARLLGWGALGLGLIDMLIFNYPSVMSGTPPIWPAILFMVIVGLPASGIGTGSNTLLQTEVEDAYRGRVFSALGTTMSALMIVGSLIAGTIGERFGVIAVLNTQSFSYVFAGLVALLLLAPVVHRSRAAAVPASATELP